jgi:hypothetical protein
MARTYAGGKTFHAPCAAEGCDKKGARQRYCLSHYITYVYRKRPEVKSAMREFNCKAKPRFNRAKHWVKNHGIEWGLSFEDFERLILSGCHYCEADITSETGRGLDRIDPLKGYDVDNVVPSCGRCNRVRGYQFTVEELRVMMQALKKYKGA